jgi:hypothetical protein
MLRRFQLAFHERLVDDHLYGEIGDFFLLPTFYLLAHRLKVPCIRSTPTEMQSMSENDFECFASAGVNAPPMAQDDGWANRK